MVKVYELKYDDFQGKEVIISIYDANETVQGEITSIKGDVNPFSVTYNCDKNIITSNATLSILSEVDRQFEWMIDRDRFRWVIKVERAATLIWEGYIDTESYEEDYGDTFNYFVTFQCNDGLGLLNRVRVDEIGLDFENLVHPNEVLQKITAFYTNLNTAVSGSSSVQVENPLNLTFESFLTTVLINPSSYIDEDGEYLFCDEALESFMKPLKLKMYRAGDGLKYYNENDIKNNAPLVQGVDWENKGKGQSMSIVPAINEQVVKYDNYRVSHLVKDTLSDGASFDESTQTDNGANDGMAKYTTAKGWTLESASGHFFGRFISKDEDSNVSVDGDGFLYVKNNAKDAGNHVPAFRYVSDYPCYCCADKAVVKVTMQIRPYHASTISYWRGIVRARLKFEQNGESEYYMSNSASANIAWRVNENHIDLLCQTEDGTNTEIKGTPEYDELENEGWFTVCVRNNFPLSRNGNGKMTFEILDSIDLFGGETGGNAAEGVLIKNLALEVTSEEGDNKVTEYKMFDDALKYRDKKSTTIYCGTHQGGLELGQFLIKEADANAPLYPAKYMPVSKVKYTTDNQLYDTIEDYLLESNYNQDSEARIRLSNILINTLDVYPDNIIKEDGYPTKTFKLEKVEKDFERGLSKITIKEII
ncbi:hypothetical protein [Carboxylicivirga marina]|uniref:Uncharacterized protein n=1 Tax=Carboxylicivirga marina TaxID=2800988 RepID=A0ABS1HGM0_9BACT|nr:hypothetical protein [Carboxylicivirga marina]MBK3516712.1 hypothetical protein [Carboxylicivirga marina]